MAHPPYKRWQLIPLSKLDPDGTGGVTIGKILTVPADGCELRIQIVISEAMRWAGSERAARVLEVVPLEKPGTR